MTRVSPWLFVLLTFFPALILGLWDGTISWSLVQGMSLEFALEPLGAFFLVLLAVGAPLVAVAWLRHDRGLGGYLLYLLLLVGMTGVMLAQDFIGLFIGWEIATWASYLLLLRSGRLDLETAQAYILFNLASAFLLLAAILVVYFGTGSFAIEPLTALEGTSRGAAVGLFVVAFLIKVGAVPLHFWVPGSYDQATDVFTAFLAGLMSKLGVYGLLLVLAPFPAVWDALGGAWLDGPAAGYALAWFGVITSLLATFKAIAQEDIKRLLAYSSIAQVGYVVTAIGVGSALALGGALFHSLVHTLVKLLLLLAVAGIVQQVGVRRFTDLGGLIYRMPVTFFSVLIGIIGLAGMPPLPGFASKYLVFVALLEAQWLLLFAGMILASTAAFLYCYKLIYAPFLGHAHSPALREAREAPLTLLIPQVLLMIALVVLGTVPGLAISQLLDPALQGLGLPPIGGASWGAVVTPLGHYNGGVLMAVFGGAFAIVTGLFFIIRGNMRRTTSPYDLSYAGEVPTEETPLHYASGMGRELQRIPAIAWILGHSATGFYRGLARQMQASSGVIAGAYSNNPQAWMLTAVVVFALILTAPLLIGGP